MASWIGTGASNPGDVATNGSLGVGTTSPGWKMTVNGGQSSVQPTSGSPGVFTILPSSTGDWWNVANTANGAKLVILNGDKRSANDTTDWNSAVVTITHGGLVGIGNTSPLSKLQVTNGDIEIDTAGYGLILKDSSGNRYRVTVSTSGALGTQRL